MKTVFWGNYKGGVGKTTSVFQIAGRFASQGKRVLLIDLDPQCSLSHICCRNNGVKTLKDLAIHETFNYLITLYAQMIMDKQGMKLNLLMDNVRQKIKPITHKLLVPLTNEEFKENLCFIPSTISFENARINDLAEEMSENKLNIVLIKLFLRDLEDKFDYVFFDCPPTTNILIQSVFLASDYYIVPTIIDELSAKGVPDYITEIEKTHMRYCMNTQVGGVLMQHLFSKRSKFIGVLETIYKERPGKAANADQITSLDRNIDQLIGVESLISQEAYTLHRYNYPKDDLGTKHIFRYYISNKDNRSGGESIPKNTAAGVLTPSYEKISEVLMQML